MNGDCCWELRAASVRSTDTEHNLINPISLKLGKGENEQLCMCSEGRKTGTKSSQVIITHRIHYLQACGRAPVLKHVNTSGPPQFNLRVGGEVIIVTVSLT